jgi:hypothetical protein
LIFRFPDNPCPIPQEVDRGGRNDGLRVMDVLVGVD